VLPDDLKESLDASNLLIGPGAPIAAGDAELASIRAAIRTERKLQIVYADGKGSTTRRAIWPFALAFFDRARVVVAWCELRADYRSFRTDRITALKPVAKRYPRRRLALLKEWRTRENIPEQ
jgi:predicted DNA-binding transcriptional regulator YafY